jgi:hypothetical protein
MLIESSEKKNTCQCNINHIFMGKLTLLLVVYVNKRIYLYVTTLESFDLNINRSLSLVKYYFCEEENFNLSI